MEEILNPEVEVQDVAPVAEVEVAPATVEEVEAPVAEKEAKKAQPATKQEVIARLKEIALDDNYKLPRPLKIGDRVFLTTISKEGVVTALADKKGMISVTSGILKTKVTEDKLRLIDGKVKYVAEETKKVGEGKVKKTLNTSFKPEVDVRGMIGDDAWFVVDKYLDDAILANIPTVRIIHGKGTGALRAALWKYFKFDKRIKSYRHGEYGEGDAGVTVITLG